MRNLFWQFLFLLLVVLSPQVLSPQGAAAAEQPNFVWIVSEDNSIHYLRHFFPGGAAAPNIEALAREGLTFDHAFSNSPVCSVARTTLATSCYAPRIGTQFHRKYRQAPMPPGLKMFPAYLRQAGYYTTNNAKTDYNAIPSKDVWDESSRRAGWRNRPDKNQPFFHMESHGQSHESSLHFNRATFDNEKTDADQATLKLADYFPDTPMFRYTHARYLDRMGVIDKIVGATVAKLKKDGLLENTFVFYFGDHGGVLPRSKGYVYESGLHVPLVVRVPKKFKHLVDVERGKRMKGFVSFIDFGPTVLHLAGVTVPEQVDGRAFLGPDVTAQQVNARDESFGYADRFDEKYDLVRSLRKGKYHYIRNFQPYLPDALQNNYRYKMLAFKEWRELFQQGKLGQAQKQFFQRKPVEALFDAEKDPHEVRNLADDPKHRAVLLDLRKRLHQRLLKLPDLSFYPESYLAEHAMRGPVAFGLERRREIGHLVEISQLALLPFAQAKPRLSAILQSENALHRFWGVTVCSSFGKQASGLSADVKKLLSDREEMVRVRAAEFLGLIGAIKPQPVLTKIVNSTTNSILATEALNSIVLFRDFYPGNSVKRSDFRPRAMGADVDDRLNYINGQPYPKKKGRRKKKRKNRSKE